MFDLNDLYYFYLTAEHGGFTAAERHSGVTKSLLSRRIARLEEQLHVRLIQRNSRQFALTSAGKILFQHAVEIVREQQIAWESLSEHVAEPTGLIRVSCPTVLAQYFLAPILPGFMSSYPAVNVYLDATDRSVQIIEEGFDIALKVSAEPEENPGFIVRPLVINKLVLVASPDYIAKNSPLSHPSDIATQRTISAPSDGFVQEEKWELINQDGGSITVRHKPALFCMNPRVQLEAAINGIGVALLPRAIAAGVIEKGALVQILPGWSTKEQTIYAMFPTRKHMIPAVRVFIDFLVQHFPQSFNLS